MASLRLNIVRFGIMITITMIDDKITLMTVIRIVVGAEVMLKITAVILLGSIIFLFFFYNLVSTFLRIC